MPGTVFMGGDQVTLRTIRPADYSFLERHFNDPAIRTQAGVPFPWSESTVAEFVEETDDTVQFLVCRDGSPVGHVALTELDTQARTVELGWLVITPEEHGNGYATEAGHLCLDHAVDDLFEVGEKPVNRVSGWRFVESTVVPDEAVLEFSCNRTRSVDILAVAVQKAAKEIWWLMHSCSPPRSGGEHVVLQQKLELKMLEQRYSLGSRDIQEVVYRSYVLQGAGARRHSSNTLLPSLRTFL